MPRSLTSLLSLALATSMAATLVPVRASAANRTVTAGALAGTAALLNAKQMAPASVLGLDGEDTKAAEKLTTALRGAFKDRGLSGGEEISLVEMRLTMGCDNLEPGCLAEGGDALSVDKLIYGELHTQGEDFQLELQILEVSSKSVTNQESFKVVAADLEPDRIDARAQAIVSELLGEATDSEPVPSAGTEYDTQPEIEPDPVVEDEPREGKYYFGRDKNGSPTWKKAGLGVGLALTLAGAGTIIGVGLYVRSLEEDIVADAQASSGASEISTANITAGITAICAQAGAQLPTGVYNGPIGTKCRNGERAAAGTNAAIAGTVVGGVMSIIFGTLLLVHKKEPGMEAFRRHQLRFGASPSRGGASVGTSFKF